MAGIKKKFVRGTPQHSYKIVGELLGVSAGTVQNMILDKRLKSTSLPDVVAYIKQTEKKDQGTNFLPPIMIKNDH